MTEKIHPDCCRSCCWSQRFEELGLVCLNVPVGVTPTSGNIRAYRTVADGDEILEDCPVRAGVSVSDGV